MDGAGSGGNLRSRMRAPLTGLAAGVPPRPTSPLKKDGSYTGIANGNGHHPPTFERIDNQTAGAAEALSGGGGEHTANGVKHGYPRVVSFTPPASVSTPQLHPSKFNLDRDIPAESLGEAPSAATSAPNGDGLRSREGNESVCSLNMLPKAVEQWAMVQRTMHEEDPQFTFAIQGQGAFRQNFSILVFLLTQGSGKDKVLKLLQNIAGLVSATAVSRAAVGNANAVEAELSRYRKVLRTFKILPEVNKILNNYEENTLTRRLMHAQHICSIFYYALDHVLGALEVGVTRVTERVLSKIRAFRNVVSVLRLVCAFPTDYQHYRAGKVQEGEIRKERRDMGDDAGAEAHRQAELHAIAVHRAHLKRGLFANCINFMLLMASLDVPVFRRLTPTHMSICGIITAILGVYKVIRRIADNQLTLQFA